MRARQPALPRPLPVPSTAVRARVTALTRRAGAVPWVVPLLLGAWLLAATATARGQEPEREAATAEEATPATTAASETTGEEPPEVRASQPETPEEKFARVTSPGPHHEHLARQEGEWQAEIRIWTAPEGEPIVTEGIIEARMILGGRFLETNFRGELFGDPFEGKGIDGYDNHAQRYVGTWRDNLGTLTLYFRGECKDDGTVRTVTAELTDPISGKALRNKGVTTFSLEEETYTYESFLVAADGTEFKNLEIAARRK